MRSSPSLFPLQYDNKYVRHSLDDNIIPPIPPKISKASAIVSGPIAKPRMQQVYLGDPEKRPTKEVETPIQDSLNSDPNNTYETYHRLNTNFQKLPNRANFGISPTSRIHIAPKVPPRQKSNTKF